MFGARFLLAVCHRSRCECMTRNHNVTTPGFQPAPVKNPPGVSQSRQNVATCAEDIHDPAENSRGAGASCARPSVPVVTTTKARRTARKEAVMNYQNLRQCVSDLERTGQLV